MQPFRVLLINPSSERFYVPSAPLGLAYLAASLPGDVEVEGLDLNVLKWVHGLDEAGIDATVDRYLSRSEMHHVKPDLIGMTVYEETLPQTERIAGIAGRYGVSTVAGGIYPTMFPRQMPEAVDWVIRGEGETAFKLLVEALIRRKAGFEASYSNIPGILYRKSDGEWLESQRPALSCSRNSIRPRRDIFNGLNMGFRYFSARIVSSSGCPYACKFCANSEYARREWIPRPVEDVAGEIEAILNDAAISEISFSDDQFLGFKPEHYRRAYLLLKSIEALTSQRNLRINLQVRADRFLEALEAEPDLAHVIRKINTNFIDPSAEVSQSVHGRPVRGFALDIGVESFLNRRLREMGKGIESGKNVRAIRTARELGVDLGVYMLTFTPDITFEELREEYACFYHEVINSDAFSKAAYFGFFQELIPYRGTSVHRELSEAEALVPNEAVSGFRFQDLRVAAFYLLYLYCIRFGGLSAAKSKGEILSAVEGIFIQASKTMQDPKAVDVLSGVICEMKDDQRLEALFNQFMQTIYESRAGGLI